MGTVCIKGFNSSELFEIIYDCETENAHHGQTFSWNLGLKTIRDTYLPNMWSVIKKGMLWDIKPWLMPPP